jgi:hypothetical protein
MQLDPNWVAGFVDGEGTFYVGINKQSSMKVGYQVLPEFEIVQHNKDLKLLYALKKFFNAGVVRVNHDNRYELIIRDVNILNLKIVPFFQKYKLNTQKKFDFIKFSKILDLMSEGKHLTSEGLINIIEIASKMNRADKKKAIEIKRKLIDG